MNLNPVVIIPTYWSRSRSRGLSERSVQYDHMTCIDQDGELPRCLASLEQVVGLGRVVLLAVGEPGVENQALEKVCEIADRFPRLHTVVIGEPELRHIHRQMEQFGLGAFAPSICLTGYGAIHNLGLLVASIFGHDTVIFIDDDEIVLGSDFLEKAVYGIAMQTPAGSLVTAKTGFFVDKAGNYSAPQNIPIHDFFWNKAQAFNEYITRVVNGERLTRSNVACGGCLVLHADMYGSVAFDPWINRGEDLDYLLSVRMFGGDIWFDNQLVLRHIPPKSSSEVLRFEQDVRRWFYEIRKIEFAKTQIDLLQINPKTLAPYPGPWISASIGRRARITACLRALFCSEHGAYWHVVTKGIKQASKYARKNCAKYFEFQHRWPSIVRTLWACTPVAALLENNHVTSKNSAFTGRFSAVKKSDTEK